MAAQWQGRKKKCCLASRGKCPWLSISRRSNCMESEGWGSGGGCKLWLKFSERLVCSSSLGNSRFIVLPPCFCLLRDPSCCAFPHQEQYAFAWYRVALLNCLVMLRAVPRCSVVFISGVARHWGTFLHNVLKCLPRCHCADPCAYMCTPLVSSGFYTLASVVAGGPAGSWLWQRTVQQPEGREDWGAAETVAW